MLSLAETQQIDSQRRVPRILVSTNSRHPSWSLIAEYRRDRGHSRCDRSRNHALGVLLGHHNRGL